VWRGRLRSVFPNVTVCVSDAVAERLREDYRFPPGRLITVRNGVDTERFREDVAARARLRLEWGVPEGRVLFGAMCRLVPEKGIDLCVQAFRRVCDDTARDSIQLVVVGDGPERPRLEQMVQQLGLGDRVRFTGFRADTPAVLSAIDVLVLSSYLEGLPLTVLEALSVGRPVIATRVFGTPEIFTRDDLGWLVDPGDVGGLADAMRLAADASLRQLAQMRSAARLQAVERFDASKAYLQLVSAIEAGQE
jgi:glycosyltransferase involved in cell wall biosynthesis